MSDLEKIKQLRQSTGAGFKDCNAAIKEANGDLEKAAEILRVKGISKASKKMSRDAKEGVVALSGDQNKTSVIEVNCETDFVARNTEFQDFAKEVAMQIAASDPKFISKDDMPESFIEEERKILTAQAIESGKKPELVEKVVEGKLNKVLQESCLLNQVYIRDSKLKVEDLLNELVSKLGENVKISRFIRYQLGEALNNE